jgi:hypothetical protein
MRERCGKLKCGAISKLKTYGIAWLYPDSSGAVAHPHVGSAAYGLSEHDPLTVPPGPVGINSCFWREKKLGGIIEVIVLIILE